MSFLTLSFLWASVAVVIPIVIALWNIRQTKKIAFGAYRLLKKVTELPRSQIKIWQWLRLLNRILLIVAMVFLFAEPLMTRMVWDQASNGFIIFLDVGRVNVATQKSGQPVWKESLERLQKTLQTIPQQARGAILQFSDTCDPLTLKNGQWTTTAEKWLEQISAESLGWNGAPTTKEGIENCQSRAGSLFSEGKPLQILISTLPETLKKIPDSMQVEQLLPPQNLEEQDLKIEQKSIAAKTTLSWSPPQVRSLSLITKRSEEKIGKVEGTIDLVPEESAWLWMEGTTQDPFLGHKILRLKTLASSEITLWTEKESPGFLSLWSALRSHPTVKVTRQIGGSPQGDAIIVYGSFKWSPPLEVKTCYFINPEAPSGWEPRDKKRWSPGVDFQDLRSSFRMSTPDGPILIKHYTLYDLDRFGVVESFDDGTPSLLELKGSSQRQWIFPFNLEDLTTDLSLEPTFIPYLYRHLDLWLSQPTIDEDDGSWNPLWLMPADIKPTQSVIQRQAWPGVYEMKNQFKEVMPAPLPLKYFEAKSSEKSSSLKEEKVSKRDLVLKIVATTGLLELVFAFLSSYWGMVFVFLICFLQPSVGAAVVERPIPLGVTAQTDMDRKMALTQLIEDTETMCNLDFKTPEVVSVSQWWKFPIVVVASSKSFGPFSKKERDQIRDYGDRGGFLVFDDPSAQESSPFSKSVQEEMSKIYPGHPWESVSREDVLFRTFYLMREVGGRRLASPSLLGIKLDGRWVAILSSNDLLGANLRSASGDFAYSVSPYGMTQRMLSKRLWINFLMYSVTGDYKTDAIHLPHILKRRAR